MQVLIENGIAFIIALQAAMGDWLIAPMRFFSYFGNEEFFLLVLPLIYWCIDSALGLRVGFILLTSNLLNYVFKLMFIGPRPYWVSSHVRALWLTETTFGIPSGHAQNAAGVWGMIAAYINRTWVWVVCDHGHIFDWFFTHVSRRAFSPRCNFWMASRCSGLCGFSCVSGTRSAHGLARKL